MTNAALNGKNIAVTGGAGLIGSFLCEELLACGARVIVIDDFSKGLRGNVERLRGEVKLREGDLEDLSFTREALADAEVVMHLASRAYGIGYSEDHHLATLVHNERITNNLIVTLADVRPRHVLIASSSCVYRDDGPESLSERPIFDGEPELANWGYGWAKRFLEQKMAVFSRETGIPVTVVRPFNIYGERYRWVGKYSQAIPMLVKRILDGEDPVTVWGSGMQRRNYLHASDCARLMRRLVELRYADGPINIGYEDTVSIKELVGLICGVANRAPKVCFDPNRPEGRFIKSADATRLRAVVGAFPIVTIDIEAGLRRMLDWYRDNFSEGTQVGG